MMLSTIERIYIAYITFAMTSIYDVSLRDVVVADEAARNRIM